jgi:hypothetical protein
MSAEWGGLRVGRRRLREEACPGYEEACARFEFVQQKRQRRGYTALFSDMTISGIAEKMPSSVGNLSDKAS